MSKKRIFLDVGRFEGVAIQQYCVDDSWTIYSWDPYPQENLKLPEHTFYKEAVWIEDGLINLSVDPRRQATHITGIAGTDFDERVLVPCVNFSKVVADIVNQEKPDVIVCSFDAEGAEFEVLRKMIADGTAKYINVLDIEFHHRMMLNEDDETAKKLIKELSQLGVIVRLKVVLN